VNINTNNHAKFNVALAGGNYTITATSFGYHPFSENFSISPGKTLNVTIELKPLHNSSPITEYVIYAGIALAVVVVLAVLVLITRGKHRKTSIYAVYANLFQKYIKPEKISFLHSY
jgi:hypothetical protein